MQPADPVRPTPPAGVFRVGLGNGSAAIRARDQDVGVGHVAGELGVSPGSLRRWGVAEWDYAAEDAVLVRLDL